jgi:sec-independent protein translocase protein TatA
MPGNIGWTGAVVIILVLLIIFGPKRLPEMGRSLGNGMREFKDSISGNDRDDEPDRPQLEQPAVTTPQPPDAQPQAEAQAQPEPPAQAEPQTQPESERVSS